MANQFDLEQQILACWNVTSDLDTLFEELVENAEGFDRDKASNFVLGLTTIYGAKFEKLFRTFEEFLKEYYTLKKQVEASQYVANLEIDEEDPNAPEDYLDDFFTPDAPFGLPAEDHTTDVESVRKQYHEELAGLSDDELVRTIREQYTDQSSPINVNVNYRG